MKKNTNLLQKITVILSFVTTTSCIIIGEDYDNEKLTKSSAIVTSAINALGSSQDTSDLYFNFVHLGNTNDVSNLNTRLNSIDTELATKATSTQVTAAQTNIQGTAADSTAQTIGAIQGNGFAASDNLHNIKAAITTMASSTTLNAVQSAIQGTTSDTTQKTIGAVQGSGFSSSVNSLVALKNAVTTLGTSALATPANVTAAQTNIQGTAADSTAQTIGAIQGNGFAASDNLHNIKAAITTMASSTTLNAVQSAIQGTTSDSTQKTIGAVQGFGFSSSANSLVALKNAVTTLGTSALATTSQVSTLGNSALATYAQAATIDSHVTTLGTSALATASALLALGSSTDTSSLNLLPVILQTGIIELAANNPAILATFAGTTSGGVSSTTINTALGTIANNTDTLISNLYDYIQAPTGAKITTINATITSLQTNIASTITSLSTYGVGSVTSAYSTARIINALNRLSYSVTAIQQVPLNL